MTLWTLGGILTFWSFGYAMLIGSDTWWHLAAGRWLREHPSLPFVDPFSYTRTGQRWLHHEWLSDVLFDLWVRPLGLLSLAWWKWGLIVATFLLLFFTLWRVTGGAVSSYLASVLAAAVASPFLDVRPHLYTLLGTVVLLNVLLVRPRLERALPVIFLIWVNLHGGFFFGVLALSLVLAAQALAGERRFPAWLWIACILLCFINPNGIEAFTYPLKYAFDSTSPFRTLGEWLPPFQPGGIRSPLYPFAIGLFLASAGFLFLSGAWRRQRGAFLAGLALGALTLAMSLRSRRFITLFALSQAPLVALALARLLAPFARRWTGGPMTSGEAREAARSSGPAVGSWRRRSIRFRLASLAPPLAATLLGALWLFPYPRASYAFHYLTLEDTFPVETCNFVEANALSGRVFAWYGWGGYLDFRTAGRMKVFIDGRADTVFDRATYRSYLKALGMQPGWMEEIESSGADFVLWPRSSGGTIRDLIATGRWRALYQDWVSALLVRADRPLAALLNPSPETAWRELTIAGDLIDRSQTAEAETHLRRALDLMPYLSAACDSLSRVQTLNGSADSGRATMRRCQSLFPDPSMERAFEEFLASRSPARSP